jgi:hypothetical protein
MSQEEKIKDFLYEAAISFAGEDRSIARELVGALKKYDINMFFDEAEQETLIGKNLYTHLKNLYSQQCRYCILLVSKHYVKKRWTSRVELPAAQERDFISKREYILPVLLDNTKVPGLESTIGHIDLRTTQLDKAANILAKKILRSRYEHEDRIQKPTNIPKAQLARFPNMSTKKISSLFYERLYNCRIGEIRLLAICALKALKSPMFHLTLELLNNKLTKEKRTVTLRFYLLDPECDALGEFARLSDESPTNLSERIKEAHRIIKTLVSDSTKQLLRIRVYFYRFLPTIQLLQADEEYWYRAYKIGQRQGAFNMYYASGDRESNEYVNILHNYIKALGYQSRQVDENWF